MSFTRSNPDPLHKPTLWALVDCNSFYCSCERMFRPDLNGKPVVVLSNNDGCLIALTPEAKSLGYKMGDVYFKLKQKLSCDGVTVFSSNYTLYGDISSRVMAAMESLVPVDQYSIDEAFVPMYPALAAQAADVGWAVHDRVKHWVGMPVRVGIGATRTLAKLANHWAKKLSPVLYLELGSRQLEECLEKTSTSDVWGIGRRQSAKLALRSINNARQLRDIDLDQAMKLLSVVGQRTVLELRGIQCIMEDDAPVPRKTLINSRSFGRRVRHKEDLAEALAMHCAIAGERLRAEGLEASGLAVHAETSRHAERPWSEIGASVRLPIPTSITTEFIRAANEALEKCYRPGDYMKGGVMLFDIAEKGARQLTLAEISPPPDKLRQRALMETMDRINDKHGRNTLRLAAQGPGEAFWHMRREMMSRHFTTSWKDIPII